MGRSMFCLVRRPKAPMKLEAGNPKLNRDVPPSGEFNNFGQLKVANSLNSSTFLDFHKRWKLSASKVL